MHGASVFQAGGGFTAGFLCVLPRTSSQVPAAITELPTKYIILRHLNMNLLKVWSDLYSALCKDGDDGNSQSCVDPVWGLNPVSGKLSL